MIAELGLEFSRKCSVQRRFGNVIGTAVPDKYVSAVLISSTASGIRQLNFEDGQLEFVSKNFPVALNNSVCLKCVKFDPSAVILSNCSIKTWMTYPAGSLVISIGSSSGPFSIIVHEFIELREFENRTI